MASFREYMIAMHWVGQRVRQHPRAAVFAAVFLVGALYVGNALCPSSYALGLRELGFAEAKPVAGQAREIRADEWRVITPLTQAAVNNNFERYNKTSFYNEDLRTFISLPLRDWALAFKPAQWLYGLAPPAIAFSFYHFFLSLLFLSGYTILFRKIGLDTGVSACLSLICFFSGFAQFWWTTIGGMLAYFPWTIIVALGRMHWAAQLPLMAWATAAMLLAIFYPPGAIPLAFVAAFIYVKHRPRQQSGWRMFAVGLGAVLGAIIVAVYLKDYLEGSINTIYPGKRRVGGGNSGFEQLWFSNFLPTAFFHQFSPLVADNICEIGTLGTYYNLGVMCFLDWRHATLRRVTHLGYVLVPLLLVSLWAHVPVPSAFGKVFLWDFVPGRRMLFAEGFLWLLLSACAAKSIGLCLTRGRLALFSVLVFSGWWIFKYEHLASGPQSPSVGLDLLILPLVGIACMCRRYTSLSPNLGLALSSALFNVVAFADFNPLQSARPIFERAQSAYTQAFAAAVQDHALLVEGPSGALLNGYGFPSVVHTLPKPELAIFARMFPDMTPNELNKVFNRFAHIVISPGIQQPAVMAPDAVKIPGPTLCQSLASMSASQARAVTATGFIEAADRRDGTFIVTGWTPTHGPAAASQFFIGGGSKKYRVKQVEAMPRPDVANVLNDARLFCSGFRVAFVPDDTLPTAAGVEPANLCVGIKDRGRILNMASQVPGLAACSNHAG